MVDFETWTEVHARARRGVGKRKIARELGLDRKTVHRILRQTRPQPYVRRTARPSILAPHLPYLERRADEVDYNAKRLFHELRAQGYAGGYEMVKLAVRPLRGARAQREAATVRFETPPGRQAQVDWGTAVVWLGDQPQRVHVFALVLGYSRCQYAEAVLDERLPTFLACHEHAFAWFGGLTTEILYDNPKTVVLRRDAAGTAIHWNPTFRDFAEYYGFLPKLCPLYRARTKGKVEAGIKYLKRSFLRGRRFASLADLNAQLQAWLRTVADQRVHGTTHEQPAARFPAEQLHPIAGRPPYPFPQVDVRQVATDCLVTVATNRYSVPWRFVGATVEVQPGPGDALRIYHQGTLIATHLRPEGRHRVCADPTHYAGLRVRLPAPAPCWGAALPPEVEVRDLGVYAAFLEEVAHG
jgi:transposase